MQQNGRLIRTCHKAAGDLRDLARQRPAQAPKLMQIASRLDSVARDMDRPLPDPVLLNQLFFGDGQAPLRRSA